MAVEDAPRFRLSTAEPLIRRCAEHWEQTERRHRPATRRRVVAAQGRDDGLAARRTEGLTSHRASEILTAPQRKCQLIPNLADRDCDLAAVPRLGYGEITAATEDLRYNERREELQLRPFGGHLTNSTPPGGRMPCRTRRSHR